MQKNTALKIRYKVNIVKYTCWKTTFRLGSFPDQRASALKKLKNCVFPTRYFSVNTLTAMA